jgi:hypothetical protein
VHSATGLLDPGCMSYPLSSLNSLLCAANLLLVSPESVHAVMRRQCGQLHCPFMDCPNPCCQYSSCLLAVPLPLAVYLHPLHTHAPGVIQPVVLHTPAHQQAQGHN